MLVINKTHWLFLRPTLKCLYSMQLITTLDWLVKLPVWQTTKSPFSNKLMGAVDQI